MATTPNRPDEITESRINIIGEGCRLEGEVLFDQMTRVHGVVKGKIRARDGSVLILGETALVEGEIQADTLIVDGFVQGNIVARTLVVVSRTGRVVGNISSPSLKLEFGSFFEGRSENSRAIAPPAAPASAPTPALST